MMRVVFGERLERLANSGKDRMKGSRNVQTGKPVYVRQELGGIGIQALQSAAGACAMCYVIPSVSTPR
jgi:hypothetical protein